MKTNHLSFLMRFAFILTFAVLAGLKAAAGDIIGTVHAEPFAEADNASSPDNAYGSLKYKFVQRVDYSAMHDFVVYIDGLTVTNSSASTNTATVTTTKIAQHRAEFFPHVLPVMAGTKVEWPNNDDIYHNVFSDSYPPGFNLGLYKGSPPDKNVVFDHPGRWDVFCSIHENMHCIVYVMSNPYFASTDAGGHYVISNVPPGTYKLKAWHERLPVAEQSVIVPTNGPVKVDFTLTPRNLPSN